MEFYVLNYQFRPIFSKIGTNESAENLMEHKQTYIDEFFTKDRVHKIGNIFDSYFGTTVSFRNIRHENNIYVMDFLVSHSLQSFHQEAKIIFDNRENVQRIFIEKKKNSLSADDFAKDIQATLRRYLSKKNLTITLQSVFDGNEFWGCVNNKPITKVQFEISYPNLPRLRQIQSKMFENIQKATNSKIKLSLEALDGDGVLTLDKNDEDLNNLVDVSAESGNTISVKLKGVYKQETIGSVTKTLKIDDMEFNGKTIDFIKLLKNIS